MFDVAAMGARIRSLRLNKQMTQEQLADRLGLSVSFVGHIERGNRQPSLETLVGLADALDVSTDFLLMGVDGIRLTNEQICVLRDIRKVFSQTEWLEGLEDGEVQT